MLVDRGQGCYKTLYNVRTAPTTNNYLILHVNRAKIEKFCPKRKKDRGAERGVVFGNG